MPSRDQLLETTKEFFAALTSKKDLDTILAYFSTSHKPSAMEHGESKLAPFFGKEYVGREGIKTYFGDIGAAVAFENLELSEFIVDSESAKVAVTGKAKITWLSTQESYSETFAAVLDFDDEAKIAEYQVWADTGSAYLARTGGLKKLKGEEAALIDI